MPKKSDAAVGRLAIMDAALNDLLRDLVVAIRVPGLLVERLTTGQAAQALLRQARADSALFGPDVKDWLKRVNEAAEKRNKVMHAVAKDQCVICSDATRFEHKGQPVDRSVVGIMAVSTEFRDLIDGGVRHARAISETLNERARADAAQEAAATGQVQAPSRILIGQTSYRCGNCSSGGKAIVSVTLPTAAVVLPP